MLIHALLLGGAAMLGRGIWRARQRDRQAPTDPRAEPAAEEGAADAADTLDRDLALSGGGLVAAIGGSVGVPALSWVALPLVLVPLGPLARSSWAGLREKRTLTFDGLALGSVAVTLVAGHVVVCAAGLTIFLGGRRLQVATQRRVRADLAGAFDGWGESVCVLRDGVEHELPLDAVRVSDRIRVVAGQAVPCDGVLVEGLVTVDERRLTGESILKEKVPGDTMLGATLVTRGEAVLRVERAGRETLAGRLATIIAGTESYEQTVAAESEEVADALVPPILVGAGLGAALRGAVGGVAGLWTNCLDTLWVSAPLSVLALTRAATGNGILIKDGRSLDLIGRIDTFVFDKTGTLTHEDLTVVAVHAFDGADRNGVLTAAAAAERRQGHPVARAIVRAADARGLGHGDLPVAEMHYRTGFGVEIAVDGRRVAIGSLRMMQSLDIGLSPAVAELAVRAGSAGHSLVGVAIDGRAVGVIELAPEIRPEAAAVVAALHRLGFETLILTGDDVGPTEALARRLGIDRWQARVLPGDKSAAVDALQQAGRRVCFVGDGVNDALAMHRATVSVSLADASAIAIDSAQVIIGERGLAHLPDLVELGRRHARTRQRIASAVAGPNLVALGGVLFGGWGVAAALAAVSLSLGAGLVIASSDALWRPDEPVDA